jgi:hypothetical protein
VAVDQYLLFGQILPVLAVVLAAVLLVRAVHMMGALHIKAVLVVVLGPLFIV